LIPGAPPALAAEIEPDRPELTESAKLVPRGAVQMESGLAFSRERRAGRATEETFEAGADFRIGVTRNVELNLGWEPLVRVRGAEDDTGIGDVTLGVRYRFVEGFEDVTWPPHLAVKVFAKLPAAEEPLGTGRPDFGALLLASFELPYEFELEVNLGAAAVGQPGRTAISLRASPRHRSHAIWRRRCWGSSSCSSARVTSGTAASSSPRRSVSSTD
jgi:hypothetical protein